MEPEVDARARRLLQDLRAALARAIARSPEAGSALAKARAEGFEVHLLIDREREALRVDPAPADPVERPWGEAARRDPSFRINASDLFFLRSIGIDPTRRVRGVR